MQKPTNSLSYQGLWVARGETKGVQDDRMSDLSESKREEGGGGGGVWTDRMDRWKGGMKLYKTHLSLSIMEKIKAHERYKHICYRVVQLLYFDLLESVLSTQVRLCDSMSVRVPHFPQKPTTPRPPLYECM